MSNKNNTSFSKRPIFKNQLILHYENKGNVKTQFQRQIGTLLFQILTSKEKNVNTDSSSFIISFIMDLKKKKNIPN